MNIAQLRERKPHLGTWLSLGSSVVAELAADCGFNWLLVDLEHGSGSEAALVPQLQAIRGSGTAALVRVGAPHADLIARVLDWGADGIMVPHVSTEAEAEGCVTALRYPPRGRRGMSRSVRAYGYGLRPPETEVQPFLIAQIETIEAVENARAIAGVDGVDVIFVGPADLQFDLKARPDSVVRDYPACLREVAAAAASAGKQSGILLRDPADLPALLELGFTFLGIDSDLSILRVGYQNLLKAARRPTGAS